MDTELVNTIYTAKETFSTVSATFAGTSIVRVTTVTLTVGARRPTIKGKQGEMPYKLDFCLCFKFKVESMNTLCK